MNDQQIALIRWRSLIIDLDPEVTPVFEVKGNVIILRLSDMSIAFQASKHFPKGCGYGYKIFCGGEVRFVLPVEWNL